MTDLPAQHYLNVWQRRLNMAERGVTLLPPDVVADMRRLVTGLSAVDPDTAVRLEAHGCQARFMAAAAGDLIGTFQLRDTRVALIAKDFPERTGHKPRLMLRGIDARHWAPTYFR